MSDDATKDLGSRKASHEAGDAPDCCVECTADSRERPALSAKAIIQRIGGMLVAGHTHPSAPGIIAAVRGVFPVLRECDVWVTLDGSEARFSCEDIEVNMDTLVEWMGEGDPVDPPT